ncbi:MAG: acyl carrier protein [Candidatus Eisenbacteria bacterium]|uniref:Acyl carrier protein n=1 Tax=Eiseniibacteriota bacterium TaxID=2212470 RepID=A0A948RZA0_UNCEI|nr:acyl carrier protein [Candidatus Eisenbacteria bacterium]MBU1948618.1 acyl carrier protein [Candidatus Eisenbacteria bacterium]MBU2692324.1 acyl carrier protein [Candidatus Eisenbacteria bacterium]
MDIKEKVRNFITESFYVVDEMKLNDDSSLLEKGVVDSTGILEVIAFLEEKFSLQVEENEMVADNFDSISSITHFICKKLGLVVPQRNASDTPLSEAAN